MRKRCDGAKEQPRCEGEEERRSRSKGKRSRGKGSSKSVDWDVRRTVEGYAKTTPTDSSNLHHGNTALARVLRQTQDNFLRAPEVNIEQQPHV